MSALSLELNKTAQDILRANDRGGYTVPSPRLYPFQWNWDSAFTALGWAAFDLARAWQELDTLFRAQRSDGMVPHIVFWRDDPGYFPSHAVWGTKGEPPASGITQPPVAASVVRWLYGIDRRRPAQDALARLFPKLLRWHRWFFECRDPRGDALVTSIHPWETGRDNAPEWDRPLAAMPQIEIPVYHRRDTDAVTARMRPRKQEYDHYLALVAIAREGGWDQRQLAASGPFRVADLGTNLILLRANRDLLALAETLGDSGAGAQISGWIAGAEKALQSLWNEDAGAFCSRDQISGDFLGALSNASFLPFYAGIGTAAQRRSLLRHLHAIAAQVRYLLPSLPPDDPHYERVRYWRGPVWTQMNFLTARGLADCGESAWAQRIRGDTAALIEKSGFYEAFAPDDGEGTGGQDFSWTAAMWLHWARAQDQASNQAQARPKQQESTS